VGKKRRQVQGEVAPVEPTGAQADGQAGKRGTWAGRLAASGRARAGEEEQAAAELL